jgi:hypothetical protein
MEIPGAPIDRVDCCTTQEFHIGHQGSICFDKIPAVEDTDSLWSVVGKCRFCEHTIVLKLDKRSGRWTVWSTPPI